MLITVFGAPTPLRAGIADFTVLVQNARDTSVVMDADVRLTLSKPGEQDIKVSATHALATNKLLYAAYPLLPQAGEWRLSACVKSRGQQASVDGVIMVMPGRPSIAAWWLYIAFAPAGVLLFIANQVLKMRSRKRGVITALPLASVCAGESASSNESPDEGSQEHCGDNRDSMRS